MPQARGASLSSETRPLVSLLALGILLGGGGVAYGLFNGIIQCAALAIFALHREAAIRFWRSAPVGLRILGAASLAIPLAQLVPLPPAIWTVLPGRDLVAESFAVAGEYGWAPLSVDPSRTLVAALGLIPVVTILVLGYRADLRMRSLGAVAVVLLAVVGFIIGVPQVLSNSAQLYPENPMPGVMFGTFANRNSTALFFDCALVLLAAFPFPPRSPRWTGFAAFAVAILLVLGVFLTKSRTGMVLLVVPGTLFALRMLFGGSKTCGYSKPKIAAGLVGAAILLGIASLSLSNTRLQSSLERFDAEGNPREAIWEDALYSAKRYWPAGSGMGTFDEVAQVDESLENLSLKKAGRAHNDWLELAIEAGPYGLAIALGWIALILARSWSARTESDRWMRWGGSAILGAIALQSIFDYPLRNQAMLCIAAFAIVLLFAPGNQEAET